MYSASNFITYDGHRYDWNGVCNYTLTQQGTTFSPDLGVFLDLERCWGCGSCPTQVTFRNNPNELLVITRDSLFDVSIVHGRTHFMKKIVNVEVGTRAFYIFMSGVLTKTV